jgi:hypothetical protein
VVTLWLSTGAVLHDAAVVSQLDGAAAYPGGMSWPVAVHEAGHAVCAFLLGATAHAGPVTIETHGPYAGLCCGGTAPRYPAAEAAKLGAPLPLLPARIRRFYESAAMNLLAGSVSEELHAGRGMEPVVVVAVAASEVPATEVPVVLPVAEQERLDTIAAGDPESDMERAHAALAYLHNCDESAVQAHLHLLCQQTERLLAGALAGRMVRALACELIRRRTLSARQWKAILRAVT